MMNLYPDAKSEREYQVRREMAEMSRILRDNPKGEEKDRPISIYQIAKAAGATVIVFGVVYRLLDAHSIFSWQALAALFAAWVGGGMASDLPTMLYIFRTAKAAILTAVVFGVVYWLLDAHSIFSWRGLFALAAGAIGALWWFTDALLRYTDQDYDDRRYAEIAEARERSIEADNRRFEGNDVGRLGSLASDSMEDSD